MHNTTELTVMWDGTGNSHVALTIQETNIIAGQNFRL
jgi:hypothetical protein